VSFEWLIFHIDGGLVVLEKCHYISAISVVQGEELYDFLFLILSFVF